MLENIPVYFIGFGTSSSSHEEQDAPEVCIANISPLERRKRLRFGITQFAISLVVLGLLIFLGADRLWRLPLLLLFWTSAIGYFQARDKT
jgi:hypothetical protein